MALVEATRKADDGNFLRGLAQTVLQIILDADVEALIGADRHDRSDGRLTDRSGYRDRTLETRLGVATAHLEAAAPRAGVAIGEKPAFPRLSTRLRAQSAEVGFRKFFP